MTDKRYRTPDGSVLSDEDLEKGLGCDRCGGFIATRTKDETATNPADATADYAKISLIDVAGENLRPDKWTGDLCVDCRDELKSWLFNDGG